MDTIQTVYHDIFDRAVRDRKDKIIKSANWTPVDMPVNISTEAICDHLIHSAGRFCKRYASDLIISWNSFIEDLKKIEEDDYIYVFAIREDGVDGNMFFPARICQYKDYYYRDIYFLKMKKHFDEHMLYVEISLADVNHCIVRSDIDTISVESGY